jgi:hypothetical protein
MVTPLQFPGVLYYSEWVCTIDPVPVLLLSTVGCTAGTQYKQKNSMAVKGTVEKYRCARNCRRGISTPSKQTTGRASTVIVLSSGQYSRILLVLWTESSIYDTRRRERDLCQNSEQVQVWYKYCLY